MDYPAYSEELFYDRAGNRARRLVGGEEELYQYDPRNRLMALTRGGVTAPFQYDNAGNLLQDDKARYSYDAFNRTVKVETFDGNVQVNRYDAEGLRHEMEENGRLVRFIFHKEEAVPNRFTYYGQQIDPITQQYYLRTRFYNPVIGRFTQEDTYRSDGLNLYTYCANNPVFYVDPSGYVAQNFAPKIMLNSLEWILA